MLLSDLDRWRSEGTLNLHEYHAPSRLSRRLWGLPFLLAAGYMALQFFRTRTNWSGDFCGLVCVGWFGLSGLFMLCGVDSLRVDLSNGTYLRRFGLWPFVWRRRGKVDEMACIRVHSEIRHVRPREGMIDNKIEFVVVSLLWKDARLHPFKLEESPKFSDEDEDHWKLRTGAKELGRLLNLSVRDHS